jgi:hypothetical protein
MSPAATATEYLAARFADAFERPIACADSGFRRLEFFGVPGESEGAIVVARPP